MKLASAIGFRRAKDEHAGGFLWHSKDGGRLYVVRDSPRYYLCAQCDAEGRDPYVPNREAHWTPFNKSPGPLGWNETPERAPDEED